MDRSKVDLMRMTFEETVNKIRNVHIT